MMKIIKTRSEHCIIFIFVMLFFLLMHDAEGGKTSKRKKGCRYSRAGIKWSKCDPALKVKTKVAVLHGGHSRCPRTRTITKPCHTGAIFHNGCEYVQVSDWSECSADSTSSTRTLELRLGDSKFCDHMRVVSQECSPEGGKRDRDRAKQRKFGRRPKNKGQRKKKRRKKNRRKSRKKNRRRKKEKLDGSKQGDCLYQPGEWGECNSSTGLETSVQTLDMRYNVTQCEKTVMITRPCGTTTEEEGPKGKAERQKERRNRKKKRKKMKKKGKKEKKRNRKKKYPDLSKKPPRLTELHVVPHTTFVVVTWPPPGPDQFGQEIPIKGYLIGYGRGVPDLHTVDVGPTQFSYKIESLIPGAEYVISIRAQNQMGVGQALYETVITRETDGEPRTLLPPASVLAPVTSSTAINVTWVDLTGEGIESRSNGFYVRFRPLNPSTATPYKDRFQTLRSNQTYLLVDGLLPYTRYEFSVQTTDGKTNSSWSMMVWNITEEAAPTTPPRDLTVVIDPDSPGIVTLNWQPPEHPNGIITGYTVTSSTKALGGRPLVETTEVEGSKLSVTMTSLVPGWKYDLSVKGQTAKGEGPPMTLEDYQLPEVPAPIPATLKVSPVEDNPSAVQLDWDFKDKVPQDILEYLVLSSREVNWDVEKRVPPEVTTAVITDLEADTDYFLKVQARTPLLYGQESNTVLYHTPQVGASSSPPVEIPRSLQVSILSSSTAVVSWRDVDLVFQNNSLPSVRYTVRYRSLDPEVSEFKLVSPPFSTLYLSNLQPLTQYEFAVRMQRGEEVSEWSQSVTATTSDFSQPPLKVELKAWPNSPHMVTLKWQPHSASKIKEYVVLYSTDARKPPKHWLQKAAVNQNVRQQDLYDLKPGTTYHFFIQAMTDLDFGPRSKVVSYTTPNSTKSLGPVLPGVEKLQVRVVSPTAAAVHWQDPGTDRKSHSQSGQRKYTVRIRDMTHKGADDHYISASQTSHYVHDLRPGTQYEFVVKVSQGSRTSHWSEPTVKKTMESEPGSAPENLTVTMYERNPTSVLLSWQPPKQANGKITGYEVHYKKAKGAGHRWSKPLVLPGSRTTAQIHDLEPRTHYMFQIRANNAKGSGPSTNGVLYRTPRVLGTSPQDVTLTPMQDDPLNALVAWQPPASMAGRRPKSYRIFYQTEDGKDRREKSVPADTLTAVVYYLKPSTTYHFRVQAYYKHRASPQSQVAMYSIPKELLPSHSSDLFGV